MKNLILWRHAHAEKASENDDPVAADLARPLSLRGQRHAQRVAQWLHKELPKDAHIFVSPALRAQQTAAALRTPQRQVEVLELLAPNTPYSQIKAWLSQMGKTTEGTIVLVGHQPYLGQLAALLLAGQALPWSIRKGAFWWLRKHMREADIETILYAMQSAQSLPKLKQN